MKFIKPLEAQFETQGRKGTILLSSPFIKPNLSLDARLGPEDETFGPIYAQQSTQDNPDLPCKHH